MEKQQSSTPVNTDLLDENLAHDSDFWKKKLNFIPNKVLSSSACDKHGSTPIENKKPMISRIGRSSVLDRVKSFLPQIEAANKTVLQEDPENRNLENTDNCSSVIEMDIAFVNDLEKTALSNLMETLSSDASEPDSDN